MDQLRLGVYNDNASHLKAHYFLFFFFILWFSFFFLSLFCVQTVLFRLYSHSSSNYETYHPDLMPLFSQRSLGTSLLSVL